MEENKEVFVIFITADNQICGYESKDYSSFGWIDEKLTANVILNKVKSSNLYGNKWTSNIFTCDYEDGKFRKYIIVYKEDWENYSIKKRQNRLRKIGYEFKNK